MFKICMFCVFICRFIELISLYDVIRFRYGLFWFVFIARYVIYYFNIGSIILYVVFYVKILVIYMEVIWLINFVLSSSVDWCKNMMELWDLW